MNGVIYARYSSDNQREESIEGQLRECQAFAEKNDITILNTYIDRAFSAKTDNRPEFQHMIADSKKEMFDVVLVWKYDRFARNRLDSLLYKQLLQRNNIKLISVTEPIISRDDFELVQTLVVKTKRRAPKKENGEKNMPIAAVSYGITQIQTTRKSISLAAPTIRKIPVVIVKLDIISVPTQSNRW